MLKFIFGIHIHQPVGNFDHVFENAYKQCYYPFLKTMEQYPAVKFSLHTSGPLLQWIESHHPEWFKLLVKIVKRKQVELLGGGFYEPILSIIPEEDRIGQINKMTNYLKHHFNAIPKGMWTAERIWEPALPSTMAASKMAYTVLDDTHFKWAGLKDDELNGYYITEDNGAPVFVFPISKFLRYSIPFKQPSETVEYLRQIHEKYGDCVAVYADDGEKFGVWPSTHITCYEEKWLSRFFDEMQKNGDWLEFTFFEEAIENAAPLGRVYLPTASYAEMGQWSLPADGFEEYGQLEHELSDKNLREKYGYLVRGGFWRNFLSKYPEANNMHKKMLHLSALIRQASENGLVSKQALAEAIDLKWQGQCNCPYWHGVFGGLYLNHLRHATYSRFLAAENVIDRKRPTDFLESEIFDFDFDGDEEIVLRNKFLNLYIAPHSGGSIFEMDFKPALMNLTDTITRRKEGYHHKLLQANAADEKAGGSIHDRVEVKEKGLERFLIYDNYRRNSFIEHFLGSDTRLDQFQINDYAERGDFVNGRYDYKILKRKSKLMVEMSRNGIIDDVKKIELLKTLIFHAAKDVSKGEAGFEVEYQISNKSDAAIETSFAIETAWGLLAGDAHDRYYHIDGRRLENDRMTSSGILKSDKISLRDEAFGYDITLTADCTLDWWRFPIETISLSEGGFERNYQESIVMPVLPLKLEPREIRRLVLSINIRKL